MYSPHQCRTKKTLILTPYLRGQSSHFFNKSHNDRATTSVTHSFKFIHFFHTYPLKGFPKKVTPLLFNFIPFLQITIILLYDQKMFSCLRISYQSTSWYWMKQFVTTWNKVFWLSYYLLHRIIRYHNLIEWVDWVSF